MSNKQKEIPCWIAGCNLLRYEKREDNYFIAKCRVCNREVKLPEPKKTNSNDSSLFF